MTINNSNTTKGVNSNNIKTELNNLEIEKDISNFLERCSKILQNSNGIKGLKRLIFSKNIIKPENIPNYYWEAFKNIMKTTGKGGDLINGEVPENIKDNEIKKIIIKQKKSLENWIDYLSDNSCPYNISEKYFILENIISLDSNFEKRNINTTGNFPEFNQECLEKTIDSLKKDEELEKIEFENKNFKDIYKFFIKKWKAKNIEQGNLDKNRIRLSKKGKLTFGGFEFDLNIKEIYNENMPIEAINYTLGILDEKIREWMAEVDNYQIEQLKDEEVFLAKITNKLDNKEILTKEEVEFLLKSSSENKKRLKDEDLLNFFDGTLKVFDGDLDLSFLTSIPEGIKFHKRIMGNLYLYKIENFPKNIELPEGIDGSFYLNNLTDLIADIKLPKYTGGNLNLENLKILKENTILPEIIHGTLYLDSLINVEKNVEFPSCVFKDLRLPLLEELPENFNSDVYGTLYLTYLKILPKNIEGLLRVSKFLIKDSELEEKLKAKIKYLKSQK